MTDIEARARRIALNHGNVLKNFGAAEAVETTVAMIGKLVTDRCAALEAEIKEYEEGYSEIACALGDESGGNHDSIMDDIAATVARVRALEALAVELGILLTELVDIEGPQPGTSDWAVKVKAALASPLLAEILAKGGAE